MKPSPKFDLGALGSITDPELQHPHRPKPRPETGELSVDPAINLRIEDLAGAKTTYAYDSENRLKKLTASDGSATTMTYQGDGLRRSKQEAGAGPTTFVWDGSDYLQERS